MGLCVDFGRLEASCRVLNRVWRAGWTFSGDQELERISACGSVWGRHTIHFIANTYESQRADSHEATSGMWQKQDFHFVLLRDMEATQRGLVPGRCVEYRGI